MSKKIKVKNPNNWDHGIVLLNGLKRNIKAGAIVYLNVEDVEYLNSISRSFTDKHLVIDENDEEILENMNLKNSKLLDEEYIINKLKNNNNVLKSLMEEIKEDKIEQKRVFEIAKKLDLPRSKCKIIEQYTGFDFELEEEKNE